VIAPAARDALVDALGGAVRFGVPLARFTSLRVGGPADALASPPDREALGRCLRLCAEHGVPVSVLGNGFNTLVRDAGVEGLVLRVNAFRALRHDAGGELAAEAGVTHATLARHCAAHGLAGLEFAAGIPGTVGGWIAMNAGVPDREVKDAVRAVEVMSAEGARRCLPAAELGFAYRSAQGLARGAVVVAAAFRVRPCPPAEVQAEIDRHLERRARTQPLDVPSCGSVFKNPPGDFAGRLIEAAGLKGRRVGGAEISSVHANFIVNRGGATARDVLALIDEARERVLERTGTRLEPEVRVVGREAA
jgi:UDP-N-acetylmuramate dehydrogenase